MSPSLGESVDSSGTGVTGSSPVGGEVGGISSVVDPGVGSREPGTVVGTGGKDSPLKEGSVLPGKEVVGSSSIVGSGVRGCWDPGSGVDPALDGVIVLSLAGVGSSVAGPEGGRTGPVGTATGEATGAVGAVTGCVTGTAIG